jgi:hypothetical protein
MAPVNTKAKSNIESVLLNSLPRKVGRPRKIRPDGDDFVMKASKPRKSMDSDQISVSSKEKKQKSLVQAMTFAKDDTIIFDFDKSEDEDFVQEDDIEDNTIEDYMNRHLSGESYPMKKKVGRKKGSTKRTPEEKLLLEQQKEKERQERIEMKKIRSQERRLSKEEEKKALKEKSKYEKLQKQLERQREKQREKLEKKRAKEILESEKLKLKESDQVYKRTKKLTPTKSRKGSLMESDDKMPDTNADVSTSKPPKLRQKRKIDELVRAVSNATSSNALDGADDSESVLFAPFTSPNGTVSTSGSNPPSRMSINPNYSAGSVIESYDGGSGSIIKRRNRGTLKISIDTNSASKPSTTTEMGPPEDTPGGRRSMRLRSTRAPPSTLGLNALESPFGGLDSCLGQLDKHVMFGDIYPSDTPGRLMMYDLPSKQPSSLTNDMLRFDFDEVVQGFPSPRPGEKLGSSPSRWNLNSMGIISGCTPTTDGSRKRHSSVFTFDNASTTATSSNQGPVAMPKSPLEALAEASVSIRILCE